MGELKIKPTKNHEFPQNRALQPNFNHFEALFIGTDTDILSFIEKSIGNDTIGTKICAPLNLFLPLFNLAHCTHWLVIWEKSKYCTSSNAFLLAWNVQMGLIAHGQLLELPNQ